MGPVGLEFLEELEARWAWWAWWAQCVCELGLGVLGPGVSVELCVLGLEICGLFFWVGAWCAWSVMAGPVGPGLVGRVGSAGLACLVGPVGPWGYQCEFSLSHQKGSALSSQPLGFAEALANSASVLDKPKNARSLEEELGMDAGAATTEAEHTEVLNGSGSGRGEPERLGGHAQVQRILRTRHECTGVITAAHEKRVRKDLMTLPGESWSWHRHTKEHLLHHCGRCRTPRRVIVISTRAESEESSAGTP